MQLNRGGYAVVCSLPNMIHVMHMRESVQNVDIEATLPQREPASATVETYRHLSRQKYKVGNGWADNSVRNSTSHGRKESRIPYPQEEGTSAMYVWERTGFRHATMGLLS